MRKIITALMSVLLLFFLHGALAAKQPARDDALTLSIDAIDAPFSKGLRVSMPTSMGPADFVVVLAGRRVELGECFVKSAASAFCIQDNVNLDTPLHTLDGWRIEASNGLIRFEAEEHAEKACLSDAKLRDRCKIEVVVAKPADKVDFHVQRVALPKQGGRARMVISDDTKVLDEVDNCVVAADLRSAVCTADWAQTDAPVQSADGWMLKQSAGYLSLKKRAF